MTLLAILGWLVALAALYAAVRYRRRLGVVREERDRACECGMKVFRWLECVERRLLAAEKRYLELRSVLIAYMARDRRIRGLLLDEEGEDWKRGKRWEEGP